MENQLTKEQQEDLAKRSKAFNEDLIELLGKHKVGLGAVAFVLPDGRIGARPQIFDDSKAKVEETKESELVEA